MKLFSVKDKQVGEKPYDKRPIFYRQDITGGDDGEDLYLRRWSLKLPFGWTIKLHKIVRPDSDLCHHDHPWPFWTTVLRRGYAEEVSRGGWPPADRSQQEVHWTKPGRVYYRPANFRHRILSIGSGERDGPAWTLVLTRRVVREWGFHTPAGFISWRSFLSAPLKHRVLWCREPDLSEVEDEDES